MLDESESSLQTYALENINRLVHSFWAEVADELVTMYVPPCCCCHTPDGKDELMRRSDVQRRRKKLGADDVSVRLNSESLSEDLTFPSRALASLVASKVYYHLGNLDESLSFALGAGTLFDLSEVVGNAQDLAASEATEREYVETVVCTYCSYRSLTLCCDGLNA